MRCTSYDQDAVNRAVARGIELLGGVRAFVSPEEKILLKPNFLSAKKPEAAVTTHPAVFAAVADVLTQNGCQKLYYGDSPGRGSCAGVARVSGIKEAAKRSGVKPLAFDSGQSVAFADGTACKRFDVAEGVLETDALISLSKMKTHGMTRLTGALKNQFGCIYGFNKAATHAKYPDLLDFSRVLIDINRLVQPRLYIMDGITAMEGNGPRNGSPTPMNALLFSADGTALDTVFAEMVGLNPSFMPTNQAAQEMGYGACTLDEIEIVGDDLKDFINPDFKVERLPARGEAAGLGKLKYLRGLFTRRPVVNPEKCIGCGICREHCPQQPKAITMHKDPAYPEYHYNRCIRCFCCQELCPQSAIDIKTPLLGRLFIYR